MSVIVPTVERGLAPTVFLLDGNDRREAMNKIHIGLLELPDKSLGKGGHRSQQSPLAFGVDHVEGQ